MVQSDATQEYSLLEEKLSCASSDDRNIFEKITDLYFKPKSLEKNGRLYRCLGVEVFRKYCPNKGSKFSLTGSMVTGRTKKDLKLFSSATKLYEGYMYFLSRFIPILWWNLFHKELTKMH